MPFIQFLRTVFGILNDVELVKSVKITLRCASALLETRDLLASDSIHFRSILNDTRRTEEDFEEEVIVKLTRDHNR